MASEYFGAIIQNRAVCLGVLSVVLPMSVLAWGTEGWGVTSEETQPSGAGVIAVVAAATQVKPGRSKIRVSRKSG